jgi:hypothetical protein
MIVEYIYNGCLATTIRMLATNLTRRETPMTDTVNCFRHSLSYYRVQVNIHNAGITVRSTHTVLMSQ